MSLSRVATRSRIGLTAVPVHVELHLSPGLPAIAMVGMPESVMREAKERVRSAVISSGFRWPDSRLTINIAPASTPKSGASFDLAIAVAVLIASGQLPDTLANDAEFYGELSLSGDVLSTSGLLAAAWCNRETSTRLFVPSAEAAQMSALAQHVVAVSHLNDLRMPQHLTRVLPVNGAIEPTIAPRPTLLFLLANRALASCDIVRGGRSSLIDVGRTRGRQDHGCGFDWRATATTVETGQLEAALIYNVVGRTSMVSAPNARHITALVLRDSLEEPDTQHPGD